MYNGVFLGGVISFLKGSRTLLQGNSFTGSSVILKNLFENFSFAMHTRPWHKLRRLSGLSHQRLFCLSLQKQML